MSLIYWKWKIKERLIALS